MEKLPGDHSQHRLPPETPSNRMEYLKGVPNKNQFTILTWQSSGTLLGETQTACALSVTCICSLVNGPVGSGAPPISSGVCDSSQGTGERDQRCHRSALSDFRAAKRTRCSNWPVQAQTRASTQAAGFLCKGNKGPAWESLVACPCSRQAVAVYLEIVAKQQFYCLAGQVCKT